jgi:carbon-monoxide dehydrogenase medium subunit
MEDALSSNWSADAVSDAEVDEGDMLSDLHGDARYRANLVKVMAKRAVAAAG